MYCYRLERVQRGYCSALVTVSPIGLHEPRVSFEPLRPSLIAVNPAKAGTSFFSSKGALVILALLRSADYCASELVTQVNLVTVSLGLVILYTADGETMDFIHLIHRIILFISSLRRRKSVQIRIFRRLFWIEPICRII